MGGEYFIPLVTVVFAIFLLGGLIKAFRRSPLFAIALIVLFFPAFLFWGFIEMFTPSFAEEERKKQKKIEDAQLNLIRRLKEIEKNE